MSNLCSSQKEVLHALSVCPMSRNEIALYVGRKVGTICARIAELEPFIESKSKKVDAITRRSVNVLSLSKLGHKRAIELKSKRFDHKG